MYQGFLIVQHLQPQKKPLVFSALGSIRTPVISGFGGTQNDIGPFNGFY
jgi:hypothetical protein